MSISSSSVHTGVSDPARQGGSARARRTGAVVLGALFVSAGIAATVTLYRQEAAAHRVDAAMSLQSLVLRAEAAGQLDTDRVQIGAALDRLEAQGGATAAMRTQLGRAAAGEPGAPEESALLGQKQLESAIGHARTYRTVVEIEVAALLLGAVSAAASFRVGGMRRRKRSAELAATRSKRDLERILAATDEGICAVDPDGTVTSANQRLADIVGVPEPDDMVGRRVTEFLFDEIDGECRENMSFNPSSPARVLEHRCKRADGDEAWCRVVVSPLTPGSTGGLWMLVTDITQARRDSQTLAAREQQYRMLTDNITDIVFSADLEPEVRLTYLSPSVSSILGRSPNEILADKQAGERVAHLLSRGLDRAGARLESQSWLTAKQPWVVAVTGANGRRVDLEVTASFQPPDAPLTAVGVARDVTRRLELERELSDAISHDRLTGLINRTRFVQDIGGHTTRNEATLSIVDLGRFSEVNDALGERVGDAVLVETASRLRRTGRPGDIVARLGSDQFALYASGGGQMAGGDRLTRQVLEAIRSPMTVGPVSLQMTACIGTTTVAVGDPPEELIRRAAAALREAKRSGQEICAYTPCMDAQAAERLAVITDLRDAIANRDGLSVSYQPIIDVADRLSGVEALVRWTHPRLGVIRPTMFVPLAEEAGLITALTDYVLDVSLEQWAAWRKAGHNFGLSVNLSPRVLNQSTDLATTLQTRLDALGLPASDLTLEITETATAANIDTTSAALKPLAAAGIRIAIDDFGTGHSSLGRLSQLPVAELKIDRCFIEAMRTGEDADGAIVATICSLAKARGLRVVAEGIEDTSMVEPLRRIGCDYLQGFAIGPPVAAQRFTEWLEDQPSSKRQLQPATVATAAEPSAESRDRAS